MRKMLLAVFFLAALLTGANAQKKALQPATDKRFDGLDTAFARVLKDWHAAGFAVAVIEKNKVVYAKGFGYRDEEKKLPVTPNTLFAIGSCSKAFTASVLGMLSDEGKVDLDASPITYIPSLKFNNDMMNNNIKVRDMMCHRTGLPRYDYAWYLFQPQSRDSVVQQIKYMEPTAGLREKWQYNNYMFMLQGLIAEKVTGKSWEANVTERILQPLGMSNTNFTIDSMPLSADASFGYDVKDDTTIFKRRYYPILALAPAGAINSSVTDMAKWVTTWINNGKFNDKQIIPAGYVQQAISSQMIIDGGLPTKEVPDVQFANYGFAWFLASYRGHYRVEHGGNIDGFSASTSFLPSDSIGIVVLSNQDGSPVPSVVRNIIYDRMLNLKYFDWETYLKARSDSAKASAKRTDKAKVTTAKPPTMPSHAISDYQGIYTCNVAGTMELALMNDSLFALTPRYKCWLKHDNYDVFTVYPIEPGQPIDTTGNLGHLQFTMGLTGEIEQAALDGVDGITYTFSRAPKAKAMAEDSLKQYTGEYDLGGETGKIYIKNDALYLFMTGQPEYELIPIDTDKFSIKSLKGFTIQFNKKDGVVVELLAIQPNGTFKAKKK